MPARVLPEGLPDSALGDSAAAIADEARQMFADSAAGSAAVAAGRAEPTWDIDVRSYETQARVAYYIRQFRGNGRDRFAEWLARGGRYEPMIRAKLHAAGLPEDMVYLALIESGYDTRAYSSAAAVGIWQLMTGTARGLGLRVDWWVDDRRDPVRSTDGAVRFLAELDQQFGSLYLAAAAYNGGPGRVQRGLARYADEVQGESGDAAFFTLAGTNYLRVETRDYVPKLIAAALVAKDPARYGIDVHYDAALAYDSVRVPAATPLAAVAAAAHAPVSAIRDLNPEVLRGMTPPGAPFIVRVPVGAAAGFARAFRALPAGVRSAYTRVVTRRHETFGSLSRRTRVSILHLHWYNPSLRGSRYGRLPAGRVVLVPRWPVIEAARDVPNPAIERYGPGDGRVTTHVVRAGESLGLIALHYHTTVAALMRLNGLHRTLIFAGQVITVHGRAGRRYAVRRHHRVRNARR